MNLTPMQKCAIAVINEKRAITPGLLKHSYFERYRVDSRSSFGQTSAAYKCLYRLEEMGVIRQTANSIGNNLEYELFPENEKEETIGTLTPRQQKAFFELKAAHQKCLDAGIKFLNQSSLLYAFNGEYILRFGHTNPMGNRVFDASKHTKNVIRIPQELDSFSVGAILTDKGGHLLNPHFSHE